MDIKLTMAVGQGQMGDPKDIMAVQLALTMLKNKCQPTRNKKA